MSQCQGIKRDGSRCTQSVPAGVQWCFNHDPNRAEERRRNASRAGAPKGPGRSPTSKSSLRTSPQTCSPVRSAAQRPP
jgi:hypothetical protein